MIFEGNKNTKIPLSKNVSAAIVKIINNWLILKTKNKELNPTHVPKYINYVNKNNFNYWRFTKTINNHWK